MHSSIELFFQVISEWQLTFCCVAFTLYSSLLMEKQHADARNAEVESSDQTYVRVPKTSYDKVRQVLSHQQTTIEQQKVKLQATGNLYELLRTKDADLRRSRETVTSMQMALRRTEHELQRALRLQVAADKPPSPVRTSAVVRVSRGLEEDSASRSSAVLVDNDDLETDGCTAARHSVISAEPCEGTSHKDSFTTGLPTATVLPTVSASAPSSSQTVSVSEALKTVPLVSHGPLLTSMSDSSRTSSRFSCTPQVSKDLLDKVMQQNVRLKKSLRDILQYKGMSISDYLVRFWEYFR